MARLCESLRVLRVNGRCCQQAFIVSRLRQHRYAYGAQYTRQQQHAQYGVYGAIRYRWWEVVVSEVMARRHVSIALLSSTYMPCLLRRYYIVMNATPLLLFTTLPAMLRQYNRRVITASECYSCGAYVAHITTCYVTCRIMRVCHHAMPL